MFRKVFKLDMLMVVLVLFCVFSINGVRASTIRGHIKDASTGSFLPGANVMIVGTSIGTASDINGVYQLKKVPVGTYTLRVRYIGFETQDKTVVVEAGKTIVVEFEMTTTFVRGEAVVITAQAKGQIKAINMQLSSESIVDILSSERIQELPDATAAESVARLPGVSISRQGGEGNQVVIRGMSAEHNKINIEGIEIAATSSENRSVDISMISPYLLDGIEVRKAVTANYDANAMGGTVNFKVREATEGMDFDIVTQGAYSGLRSSMNDYKFVFSVDNRFFDNRLGVFMQFDTEKRTRDSETMNADYYLPNPKLNSENTTYVQRVLLEDIYRDKSRVGGALVLDYLMDQTKFKFVNFFSNIKTEETRYSEDLFCSEGYQGHQARYIEESLSILTNSLNVEHQLGNVASVDFKISRSESENNVPLNTYMNFRNQSGLSNGANVQTSPYAVFDYAANNVESEYLRRIEISDDYNKEVNWSYQLDFDYNYTLSHQVAGILKIGAKYQQKERSYDHNMTYIPAWLRSTSGSKDFIINYYGLDIPLNSLNLPLTQFLDTRYSNNDFMGGKFTMGSFPSMEMTREIARMVRRGKFPSGSYGGQDIIESDDESQWDDYSGTEDHIAFYLMTEMNLGEYIDFNPGIRYEKVQAEYTGERGDLTFGGITSMNWVAHHDTTLSRENSFLLPMIHMKIKPNEWFDCRLAYTETISRPNYRSIIPNFRIGSNSIVYGNPRLKPAHSQNIDIQLSVHSNKIGLMTLGGFHKSIKNQIFSTGGRAIPDSAAAWQYEGLAEYSWDDVIGNTIYTFVNNPHKGSVTGLEFGWQMNFWFLPGFMKGLIFNGNYTHIFSETKYPRTTVAFDYSTFTKVNNDTTYTSRLIDQPKDILNLAFGYDYKGFSGRISMLYQSNVYSSNNFWPELRGNTSDYIRWDISLKQKLPVEGLDLMVNLVNINAEFDEQINRGTGNPLVRENYGRNILAGLRYRF
ncbi:TonB-dependent receptor [bacterium]|nr:TonB-dependent receptor [bacterium]